MDKNFKDFIGESWKRVELDPQYAKDYALEISNFGRVRSITPKKGINLLNGGEVNGYKIIRLKFFKPRSEDNQKILDDYLVAIRNLKKEVKYYEKNGPAKEFNRLQNELEKLVKQKDKFLRKDNNSRAIYYQALVHRLVAEYFLPEPKEDETIVAHLDYIKTNNKYTNLKWMTQEENMAHQQKSPFVISDYKKRKNRFYPSEKNSKLTETKVMYLKKLLNEGKPMKQLVRMFKVTETQILRIKRGENWGRVPASK